MNKKIKIEPFIERLNNTDFKQGTKFKFLDKIYLYDFPNLVGVYEIGKPTKPEYSIFAQLDMTNLHCEVEILEDNIEEIQELNFKEKVYDLTLECYHDIDKGVSNTELANKINELVRAVNDLRKEKE